VKQAKAVALNDHLALKPADTILLWQVAGELLACMRRWVSRGRISVVYADEVVHDVLETFPLILPNREVITRSLSLSLRDSISHWDSMLTNTSLWPQS